MQQGETPLLLSKEEPSSCCPIPPPAPRDNTCYSYWQSFNCTCDALPIWSQHSSCAISGAAQTYSACYTPAEWYNRFIFKIFCGGDANCCDGHGGVCAWCILCVSAPRLICCSVGMTSAFIVGTLGGMYDLVTCAPCRQSMEPQEDQPYQQVSNESKDNHREDKTTKKSVKPISVSAACDQLDKWCKNNNLPEIFKFFSNPSNIELLNSSDVYLRRIYLICLAIRYSGKEITLEQRIQFIKLLIRNDTSILNGYNATEEIFPGVLLEALRSDYINSSELLEFCCMYGANVHQPAGRWSDKSSNLLQVWACSDFKMTNDDSLFYKLHILYYYENQKRPEILLKFFGKEEQLQSLDQQLTNMTDRTVQDLSPSAKGKKREEIQRGLPEQLRQQGIPKDVAFIIGQYSAIYRPSEQRESTGVVELPKIAKSVSSLIEIHSELISPAEQKDEGMLLSKYQPLPDVVRLPPVPDPTPTDSYGPL